MTTEQELSAQIAEVKEALSALGDLRPGSVSEQYNVCGNPGCRCKADPARRHGPYYQLSYTRGGRSRTEALKSEDLDAVRAQIANYKQMRALIEEWVEASIALDRLRRAATR
jgi:hypothetical protein